MLGYRVVPLGDRIRVKSIKQEQVTTGGIVLPEASLAVYNFGQVMAVGDEVKQDIKKGDYVIYIPYGGTQLTLPNHEGQLILNEADIIAKLIKEQ